MSKYLKQRLAIVLTVVLVLGLFPVVTPQSGKVARAADIVVENGSTEAYEMMDGKLFIKAAGSYVLSSNMKLIQVYANVKGVTVDLKGFTVENTGNYAIEIKDGGALTLKDSVGTGTVKGKTHSVVGQTKSEFTLAGGTITGEDGVHVVGGDSTFNMTGGKVSGCTKYGVGVNGTFNMTGGTITGNETGLYGMKMTANLSGGSITGNEMYGVSMAHTDDVVNLSGAIDISNQASATSPDFTYDDRYLVVNGIGDGEVLKLAASGGKIVNAGPTKDGKVYKLHESSRTGTDVTAGFAAPGGGVVSKPLYGTWENATGLSTPTPTVAPSANPSGSPAPTASVNPSAAPTNTPVTGPSATVSPNPNPSQDPGASASPEPTREPGTGIDSDEYKKLSEDDKVVADALVEKDPTMDYITASRAIEWAHENNIPTNTLLITEDTITKIKNDGDPDGATFGKLRLRIVKRGKTDLTLKWNLISEADGYALYGNKCNYGGDVFTLERMKNFENGEKTYKATKCERNRYYKYLMRAYKIFDGKKVTICATVRVHGCTIHKKHTVAKAVNVYQKQGKKKTLVKGSVSAKKCKNLTFTFKEIPEEKKKTIRPHRPVIFESENSKIIKVVDKKKGKLKAVGKGKVKIFAYAQNGIYKEFIINVK